MHLILFHESIMEEHVAISWKKMLEMALSPTRLNETFLPYYSASQRIKIYEPCHEKTCLWDDSN